MLTGFSRGGRGGGRGDSRGGRGGRGGNPYLNDNDLARNKGTISEFQGQKVKL